MLLEEATHQLGSAEIQQGVVYNVQTFFGWVAGVDAFCATLAG
ncbi:hypothetical protein LJR039_000128 [Pseudorhodoferax sp. LjRoot39]